MKPYLINEQVKWGKHDGGVKILCFYPELTNVRVFSVNPKP